MRSSKNDFNPLPRKEGDLVQGDDVQNATYFNPLPRKEGDLVTTPASHAHTNFNPLPRKEGDDFDGDKSLVVSDISIHSLVKRETWKMSLLYIIV